MLLQWDSFSNAGREQHRPISAGLLFRMVGYEIRSVHFESIGRIARAVAAVATEAITAVATAAVAAVATATVVVARR